MVYVCAHRVISFNVACVKKVPIQILKTYVANSLSPSKSLCNTLHNLQCSNFYAAIANVRNPVHLSEPFHPHNKGLFQKVKCLCVGY